MSVEYRVCWDASSNATFHGCSEWHTWDDPDASESEVQDAVHRGGGLSEGLETALEASGFGFSVETREVQS